MVSPCLCFSSFFNKRALSPTLPPSSLTRRLPGLREYFIGHLFALVVFHADSFAIINERTAHSYTRRFFQITFQLALDLQMVLCNRIFGSPRDIILSRDSEPGFQLLTRTTTWQQ